MQQQDTQGQAGGALVLEKGAEKAQAYTREQLETLKSTVAKGASEQQFALFLEVCRAKRLDPFSRQVHWSSQITSVIVGIDGMRAIAERTGNYVPGPTRYEHDDKNRLVAAHVTVRKRVGDQWFDIEESAYFEEYGGHSPIWRRMPRVMLAKCAESRALRRAFPDDFSGLYSEEEVSRAHEAEQPAPVRSANERVTLVKVGREAAAKSATAPKEQRVEKEAPAEKVEAKVEEKSEPKPEPTVEEKVEEKSEAPVAAEGSPSYRLLAEMIERCRTQADLNRAAQAIKAAKEGGELLDGERERLRDVYVARSKVIRGGKAAAA